MKSVYYTKALFIGMAVALALGGAVATLAASTQHRVDDSPIHVPVGRVGDRVAYAFFAGSDEAEVDWNTYGTQKVGAILLSTRPTEPPVPASMPPLIHEGVRTFDVASVGPAYDAAHELHVAVLVVGNQTLPEDPSFQAKIAEYVDLDHRVVFRMDENTALGLLDRSQVAKIEGEVQSTRFDLRQPSLPGLTYQGKTLHLGQVLREGDVSTLPGFGERVSEVHEREWVAERARINGADAYGVRYEITYRALVPMDRLGSTGATPGSADPSDSAEIRVRSWKVDWMSSQQPYAVLRETGLSYEWAGHAVPLPSHRTAYLLERLEAGNAFIDWSSDGGTGWVEAPVEAELSPATQSYPADGADSSLPYPLQDAIATVTHDTDPNLLQFQLWYAAHPQAQLAAARYGVGSFQDLAGPVVGPTMKWQLVFAVPSGDARKVSTELIPTVRAKQNQDLGPLNVPSFAATDLPVRPPTLSLLERTWEKFVSSSALEQGFNYVRWGLDVWGDAECPSSASYVTGARDVQLFGYLEGGHSADGQCPGKDQNDASSSLVLDATTGRAVSVYESRFGHDYAGIDLSSTIAQPPGWTRSPVTVPVGFKPPPPEAAAAASAGTLSLFLVAYFFPALKFLLSSTFVAGYAKIAKEDLLNNSTRDQILQLIRRNPGIHASDIARQVQSGWGTIVYHLSVLERNKIVTSLVDGRHKRFFPADTVDYSKRGQLAVLMNANTKALYELIEGAPGIVQGELAQQMGLTVPTVIWHLQRLEQAGLVGRDKEGRKFHYFSNPVYQPRKAEPSESVEVQ